MPAHAALALATSLASSSSPPLLLSRSQAVDLALSQGPDLAEARPALEVARAGVSVARQLPNPTLGFSIGPDEPTIFGTLEQRFPVFGQQSTAIEAARAEARTAESQLDARRLEIRVAVQRGYTTLALAQAELGLAKQAAALAGDLAGRTRAKVAAGLAPELDADQADLGAATAEQVVLDRTATLAEARVALARALGLSPDTPLAAADALGIPADAARTGGVHPAIEAAERDVDAAEARVAREKAAIRPTPVLALQLERLSAGPDGGASLGVRGSIALDLPVLSWNGGAIGREKAAGAVARAHLHGLETRLEAERRVAELRLASADTRARLHDEKLVPAARHVADLAREAYDLGRVPLVTLLTALGDLNRAQVGAAEAAAQAWDAREDLEEVSGEIR